MEMTLTDAYHPSLRSTLLALKENGVPLATLGARFGIGTWELEHTILVSIGLLS